MAGRKKKKRVPRLVFDAPQTPEGEAPLSAEEAALKEAFGRAQRLLLTHPIAAQGLFRAFVSEGRQYARTPEGARLRDQLTGSELIRQGRVVWEGNTFNMLEEEAHATTFLPSALLDALVAATAHEDIDVLLERFSNPWSRHDRARDSKS